MAPISKIALLVNFSFLLAVNANPASPHVRAVNVPRAGTQFITGACTSDADCASGCCGFKSGKCAGAVVAQERDGGCGFGDASPNANAAIALGATQFASAGAAATETAAAQAASAPAATGATTGGANTAAAGNGQGTQFITGACTSDADCASGCCGFKSGKCAGAVVAQERDGGCGFGDATPNASAAIALGFQPTSAAAQAQAVPAATATAAAAAGNNGNVGQGTQFITGACTSDADCASGCCGFKSGKCAGAVVAQERDGGCGFGNAAPNASAAIALGFQPTATSPAQA